MIEAAERDLHAIAQHFLVHGKGAAALGAETTLGKARRAVALRRTAQPAEGCKRKMHEAHAGRARVPAAVLAMTDHAARRRRGGSITNRPAKTTAFEVFRRHLHDSLAIACAASAEVLTGITSKRTRSLQARIQTSNSVASSVRISWKQREYSRSTQLSMYSRPGGICRPRSRARR